MGNDVDLFMLDYRGVVQDWITLILLLVLRYCQCCRHYSKIPLAPGYSSSILPVRIKSQFGNFKVDQGHTSHSIIFLVALSSKAIDSLLITSDTSINTRSHYNTT